MTSRPVGESDLQSSAPRGSSPPGEVPDFHQLAALAVGLCQDCAIGVELSPNTWAWDPVRRVILVAADDLQVKGPLYCAGVIAHEVGHYFISRYPFFSLAFPSIPALGFLLNAIEDPRVNTWIQLRYPGTRRWMAELTASDAWTEMSDPLLDFQVFGLECAREELRGWKPSRHPNLAYLAEPLARTRAARKTFASSFPSPDLQPQFDPVVLLERYRSEVWPALQARAAVTLPGLWEQEVRLLCLEYLHQAVAEIFPAAIEVLNQDVRRIASYLRGDPRRRDLAWEILNSTSRPALAELLLNVRKAAPPSSGRPIDPNLCTLALRLIDMWIQGLNRVPMIPLDSGLAPPRDPGKDSPDRGLPLSTVPVTNSTYDQAYQKVVSQVEHLARHLEDALRPRHRLRESSGFASGQKLDLRQVLRFSADPRLYDQLWMRKTIPNRRNAAVLLLLDLSGSMRGDKSEALLAGSILLAETLGRLTIPFAVFGFQDVLIPFSDFDTPFDGNARKVFTQMLREINGDRPRGNNNPSYNDDGPCLREAAEHLLEYHAQDRLLLVVSDGLPEGKHSSTADLHTAVRAVRDTRPALQLIGIGLGAGTDHVRDFYPDSVANVPVSQFASEIGAVLRQALLEP